MTGKIIHFKTAKKKVGYKNKAAKAAENRAKFGRTKSEKKLNTLEQENSKSKLDGHKLDT